MKILILGANGMLTPYVTKALEKNHELRITDVSDLSGDDEYKEHEILQVDITDLNQVVEAAKGVDAIINLAVVRHELKLAFDVNSIGCFNMMVAAKTHNIKRVINTGPHWVASAQSYEKFDFDIHPDIPHHPGTGLYAISKSAGQEICRVFAENYNINVINLLFNHLRAPFEPRMAVRPEHFWPFSIAKKDAGMSLLAAIEVDIKKLSTTCETFFISADVPHNQYSNTKAKEVLGWHPTNNFEKHWRQSAKK